MKQITYWEGKDGKRYNNAREALHADMRGILDRLRRSLVASGRFATATIDELMLPGNLETLIAIIEDYTADVDTLEEETPGWLR